MKIKRNYDENPVEQNENTEGEQSGEEKPNYCGSASPSTSSDSSESSSPSSSDLVPTKSECDLIILSNPLDTKLDKLVSEFDRLIFRHELSFTVIERNFGNKIWTDEVMKADKFWKCFIGALIRKLGNTYEEVLSNVDFTNPTTLEDGNSYTEVEAGWIWWEIKSKLGAKSASRLRLPSVGDFLSYVAKYLGDENLDGTVLENIFLVIAIFVYLYPLSQIRELAQLNNRYILKYLMDQIVDVNSLPNTIYALYALQRVLEASVHPSGAGNYEQFMEKLKKIASFMPDEEGVLDLSQVDDPQRAIQASFLAKLTLKKLAELNQLSKDLPIIRKEHALLSVSYRNWFCGTSHGYCNYQMNRSVLDINRNRHLYFEMFHLTTGSIKVGICADMRKHLSTDGAKSGFDMTTCEYTYSFDGYQKECSRDNQENIPMAVGKVTEGSVIGVILDTVERSVTYYHNGVEVQEKRKNTKSTTPLIRRSWEDNPYYVTISLAPMQHAMILLSKEEWLMPPKFAHDLEDLFYDHSCFRMAR